MNGNGTDPKRELLLRLLEQAPPTGVRPPDIAIIGVAGRYPGASNLNHFWQRLETGRSSITELPRHRWPADVRAYTRWGGFLDDVDRFDPLLFRLSPRDAAAMDPQARLFLEVCWELLEDAGYTRQTLARTGKTGVFAGVMNATYANHGVEAYAHGQEAGAFADLHAVANRVSWCFDFTGPSLAVDTACSSSLTAIHLACQSLHSGDCATAIAGGVNLVLHPMHVARLCALGMLSHGPQGKAFADDADGFVDGEGAGAVLLKPLDRALAEGDRIHAVIRASAVNAGGRTSGFTVPSVHAQAEVIAAALDRAAVSPESITYVEAHGTGTRLGDPIELTALAQAFRHGSSQVGYCTIGTVKANIGHLESAAGIAGLTRILLQMRHRRIAPSLPIARLNSKIDFAQSPFVVRQEACAWEGRPLRAALSSFGAGGSNAHLIIEEHLAAAAPVLPPGPYLFPLSAATPDQLQQLRARLVAHLESEALSEALLPSLAATLQFGREPLEARAIVAAATVPELLAALRANSTATGDLAARWLAGEALDWRALWQGPRPPIVDAPHYPFARERCWFAPAIGVRTRRFHPADPLIRDHAVGGRTVVAGCLTVAMALEACPDLPVDTPLAITGLSWLVPLVVKEPVDVTIDASPAESGQWHVAVRAGETLHSRCHIGPAAPLPNQAPPPPTPQWDDATPAYQRFANAGVVYGPSFRGLRRLASEPGRVLAEYEVSDHLSRPDALAMVLELALQAVAGLLDGAGEGGVIVVPKSIDRLVLSLETPRRGQIHAWRDSAGALHAAVADSSGARHLECTGIQTAPVALPADSFEQLFYAPRWEWFPASAVAAVGAVTWIVETPASAPLAEAIAAACPAQQTVRCRLGEPLPPGTPDCVYFLAAAEPTAAGELATALLTLAQHLRGVAELRLVVLTTGMYALLPGETVQAGGAAAAGFARALAKERTSWQVSVLDLPATLETPFLPPANLGPGEFARRDGRLYRRTLVPLMLVPASQPVFRSRGTYLIVGGAGGLGYTLSEHLASRYQARLIWTGRRPLDAAISARLAAIERLGGQAVYEAVDVADAPALRGVVLRAGELHGAFHSALVLDDCLVDRLDAGRLLAVLRPKCEGVMALTAALAGHPLDFVVFFSSAQSFTCSAGQSNYAAASVFEDAWAQYAAAQGLPVYTVNWGYWGGVGVVGDEDYARRLRSQGVLPIAPATGMEALTRILSAQLPQVAAMRLDASALRAAGLDPTAPWALAAADAIPRPDFSPAEAIDAEALTRYQAAARALDAEARRLLATVWPAAGLPAQPRYARLSSELGRIFARPHPAAPLDDAAYPELAAHLALLRRAVPQLPQVLSGQAAAPSVLFGNGDPTAVESIYRGNLVADYMNRRTALAVLAQAEAIWQANPQREVIIVEAGAGTGGTSRAIIELLATAATGPLRYWYTDVSPAFVQHGRRTLGHHPFVSFAEFDMERDPRPQGLAAGMADIVIAANAAHATQSLGRTLIHLKTLLRRQGLLALNEGIALSDFATLTFGMTDGWWLFTDEALRLPGCPLLSAEAWLAALSVAGFHHSQALGAANATPADLGSALLLATSDGLIPHPAAPAAVPTASATPAAPPPSDALDFVRGILGRAIGLDPARIDPAATFDRYGVDSLIVLQVNKALEAELGSVPESLLFEHNTAARLAEWVGQRRPQAAAPTPAPVPAPPAAPPPTPSGAIAIIGLAGRYPAAANPDRLAENLAAGQHCIREVPADRWPWRDVSSYSHWGGFLDDVDRFDARFFHISPKEAARMDPQERLFLETAWHVLEDAGYPPSALDRCDRKVGVFAGVMNSHYALLGAGAFAAGDDASTALASPWSIANRVSWFFNLSGPSLAVDTACSSSLTAIHLACESLRRGECRLAIAGGVNLVLHPLHFAQMAAMNMLSHDEHCKAFASGADGFVDGEGVGALALKPLAAALADGDRVYGIIRGSAINAGGRTAGYTVPNPLAQAEVVEVALAASGVAPETISYVEAHGTGTKLGDAIEVAGLKRAFAAHAAPGAIALGSVKPNIGHLESAAGVAGVTKVLLMMRAGQLFPTLHAEDENAKLELAGSPLRLQRTLAPWVSSTPRRAAVSSFGAGGANAHLVLEEFVETTAPTLTPSPLLFPLSARDTEALRRAAIQLAGWLAAHPDARLADVAFTLQAAREALSERAALVASTAAELQDLLHQLASADGAPVPNRLFRGTVGDAGLAQVLGGEEDAAELIGLWIAKGKLGLLGQYWAGGGALDWQRLAPRGRLLSLPGYPFARERHWFTTAPATAAPARPVAQLHPYVHRNVSTLREQAFASDWTESHPLVADHRVQGKAILPGAAYFEMMRAAAALACERPVAALRGLHWEAPFAPGPGAELRLRLQAADEGARVEAVSAAGVHARALAVVASSAVWEPVPLEAIRARCQGRASRDECYETFRRHGVEHGPSLRWIAALEFGADEVLARLEPSGVVEGEWLAGPLDAAFAATGPLVPATSDAAVFWAPIRVGELRWNAAAGVPAWAWVRRGAAPLEFDIRFANQDGATVAVLSRLEIVPVGGAAQGFFLVEPQWAAAPLSAPAQPVGPLLVFDTESTLADALRAAHAPHPVVLLEPAFANAWLSPTHATVDLRNATALQEILQQTRQRHGDIRQVLFHGSREPFLYDRRQLAALVKNDFFAARALCQALLAEPDCRFVFASTSALGAEPPHHSAFAAFSQSVMREEPRARLRLVHLADTGSPADQARTLLTELADPGQEGEVRYDGATRLRRDWVRSVISPVAEVPLRSEGVYLITGGLGGVGLALARHLSTRYRASLLLVGRRPADSQLLADLLQWTGRVETAVADVSTPEGAHHAVAEAKRLFGRLDGIVHAAGVLDDGLLLHQDEAAARRVLAPKVSGSVLLDIATQNEPLAFFALCSSFVVAAGNAGQADYAWANGFLDAFAESRERLRERGERSGQTVSIAWPAWRLAGMAMDELLQASLEQRTGLRAISAAEGAEAFEQALQLGRSRVLVAGGEAARVERLWKQESPQAANRTGDLAAALQLVREAVAAETGAAAATIQPADRFDVWGIDSVTAVRITARLEQHAGELPKTLLFEHQTIQSLAEALAHTYGVGAAAPPAPAVELPRPAAPTEPAGPEPIAIIGLSGRFPQADTLEALAQNLREGRDAISTIPAGRWNHDAFYDPTPGKLGKTYAQWGGFLDDIARFDAEFFRVNPREAEVIDPQERLFLETAYHALEDAGYPAAALAGETVGVFAGVMYAHYPLVTGGRPGANGSTPGSSFASIANRVSYSFDFRGPSLAVDTMCSSSLTAIQLAVESLRRGESTVALAGGVNLTPDPSKYLLLSQGRFASTDGRCRSFGQGGDGYVPGEGVGVAVLKPLSRAIADGDHIHGVIRAIAVNHGGRTNGYTVPNPKQQTAVIRRALASAGWTGASITCVEAHGTGTPLGDPIELRALTEAFAGAPENRCSLGSIKSNIGHLEAASGMAGLAKLLVQMRHQFLAPSLHAERLNPNLSFAGTPFRLQRELSPWESNGPRRAALSSFGAGGSNAHLLLEEYVDPRPARAPHQQPLSFPLSAANRDRLAAAVRQLHAYLVALLGLDLRDVSYTLITGREALPVRAVFTASTRDQLLAALAQGPGTEPSSTTSLTPPADGRRIPLPGYPFGGARHWMRPVAVAPTVVATVEEPVVPAVLLAPAWQAEPLSPASPRHARVAVLGESGFGFKDALARHAGVALEDPSPQRPDVLVIDGLATGSLLPAVLHTVQTFLREGATPVRVVHLRRTGAPLGATIDGLLKTLEREAPEFRCVTVLVDPTCPVAEAAAYAWAEALADSAGPVRYQNGQRAVRQMQVWPAHSAAPSRLRPRGVYLIAGAPKGIGGLVATHLASRYGARLLLCGRAPASPETAAFLAHLARLGGEAEYLSADITQPDAVHALVARARSRFGTLHGVFHSAGVLRDGPLRTKSLADFDHVLGPKVSGATLLAEATADLPLDFFALFSSAVALLGNPLQSNHVAANAYLDALASEGSGRFVSINWPLWAEGGTKVPEAVRQEMAAQTGLTELSTRAGLDALETILSSGQPQMLVISGSEENALRLFHRPAAAPPTPAVVPPPAASHVDPGQAEAWIGDLFAAATSFPRESIEPARSFADYGFDSISVGHFHAELEKHFGELPKMTLLEYTSVRDLAAYLRQERPGAFGSANAAPPATQPEIDTPEEDEEMKEPIAIVGMAGRFPGAENLDAFWANLAAGQRSLTEVPANRWDNARYFSPDPKDAQDGKIYCRRGGFLAGVDQFDPLFFRMTPLEAEMTNPEDRLLLETVWRAMESGGLAPDAWSGKRAGVFVGLTTNTYPLLGVEPGSTQITGSLDGAHFRLPNRISHFFDLTGPSFAVDTACSSSLLAVHLACQSIRTGECEAAIAGGVNLYLHPSKYQNLCRGRLVSRHEQTSLFQADADGFLPGEGVGAVILKPLSVAQRDGDFIFAVIRGSAAIHKGKGAGTLLPSPAAYAEAVRQALHRAGAAPSDVSVIEAQALGSVITDSAEWNGLQQVFRGSAPGQCALTSLKPNIGHLEAASGIAQLTKLVAQFRHEQIAPTLVAENLNPEIELAGSPFTVPAQLLPWPRVPGRARLGGITSFGAGGTGVHLLVSDEGATPMPRASAEPAIRHAFVLSARTAPALARTRELLAAYLESHPEPPLADVAFTLRTGRATLEHRCVVEAASAAELIAALRQAAASTALPTEPPPAGRRIPLPGVAFDARRVWPDAPATPVPTPTPVPTAAPAQTGSEQRVAQYYDRLLSTFGASDQPVEEYLTFAPFDAIVPGFSSLLTFAEPAARREHFDYVLGRQKEMRRVTYREVDFRRARRVLDIGCGLGTDLIQLALAYPHLELDGYTITPNQAEVGRKRAANAGLADRLRIHLRNSAREPFPGTYDVAIGFEVTFHVEEKRGLFDNISAHLRPGGQLVLADVVTRTVASVNMPALGQFTCTERQFAWHLAESRLRLTSVVDCSPEIANFLHEPDFEQNLAHLGAAHPGMNLSRKEHRGWHHFGKALAAGLFRYLLLSATRMADDAEPAQLVEANTAALANAMSWKQGSGAQPVRGITATEIEERLRTVISRALKMQPGELDPDARFADMGIDSLQGLQVLDAINRAFGLELQVQTMYDHSSVRDLARHLATRSLTITAEEAPKPEPVAAPASKDAPVAIVGLAGRFPGAADVHQLQRNLWAGVDAVREVPADRWNVAEHFDANREANGRTYGKWGGFIEDVDRFDPLFFRISPTEANLMDPQQRLFLEACWQALEDAGYAGPALDGARCGVYTGVLNNDYQALLADHGLAHANAQTMLGNSASILAARISYFLNLKGPAGSIDTACSSSLVAVHLACSALRSGEADLMLAGGVTLYLSPKSFVMMSKAGMLSPTGKCRSFDEGADGMVPGEAAGVVVLKLLDRAIADGDRIYGVIRGSGVNQDGRTNGITAPSAESQAALEASVYERFHVDPNDIGMIECHGTGTPLGDPIEIAALSTAFRQFTPATNYCAIGSAKSNLGHTSAAAGVVGLIKLVLSLQKREIPPSLHFRSGNHHIAFAGSPFFVNTALRPWAPPPSGGPRLGALSSFGFSGTNAHIVVEEYRELRPARPAAGLQLFPLSARTRPQLAQAMAELAAHLEAHPAPADGVAWTLQSGRPAFALRVIVAAETLADAVRLLAQPGEPGQLLAASPLPNPLDRTARQWLAGETVDWAQLHVRPLPVKVGLPGYPMDRIRCWFDGRDPQPPAPTPSGPALVEAPVEALPDVSQFFFVPRWTTTPDVPRHAVLNSDGTGPVWVVYPPGLSEIAAAVRTWYPNREVVGITADADFNALPVSPGCSIWFLSGLRAPGRHEDANELLAGQEPGVIAFHRLLTALAGRANESITIRVATNDVFAAGGPSPVVPQFAALHGIARTTAVEYPAWSVVLLDLSLAGASAKPDVAEWRSLLEPLAVEPPIALRGDVAIRDGRRLVRRLDPLCLDASASAGFTPEGVYLIAGGFGGVGAELCLWLAQRYRARLAILGRSPLDAAKRDRIAAITARGGEVLYIQANCADRRAMTAAVAQVRTRFGRIDGAIHAALEINRQPLAGMTETSLRAVLAPKVAGAVYFHEALASEPLRWMVYFSSLQSFTAVEGRGHYAAACTFLDSLVAKLRADSAFPVQLLNWGFWDVNDVPAESKQRLAGQGIGFFSPVAGLECMARAMASGLPQVVPVEVDETGMRLLGADPARQLRLAPPAAARHLRRVAPPAPAAPPQDLVDRLSAGHGQLEQYCRLRLLGVFQQLGAFHSSGAAHTREELAALMRLSESQTRLLEPLVDILRRGGYVATEGDFVWGQPTLDAPDLPAKLAGAAALAQDIIRQWPEIEAHTRLAAACLDGLPQILRGEIPATQVLFPNSSTRLVEGVYKDNEISSYYNRAAANAVVACVESRLAALPAGERIRLLEVGAGTGGASAGILEALRPYADRVSYDYTDISMAFANFGRARFGKQAPFANFRTLNIEQELAAQGYDLGAYDAIVAANVLHATGNIRRTARQVKSLLRRHGWLVLYEVTARQDVMTLTFGLLDGWWLFTDREERIPGSPLLSVEDWVRLLDQEGFADAVVYRGPSPTGAAAGGAHQALLLTESDGVVPAGAPATPPRVIDVPRPAAPAPSRRPAGELETAVAECICRVLNIPAQQYNADMPFMDMGVDSILAVDLINAINAELGLQLRATDMFHFSTPRALCAHLVAEFGATPAAPAAPAPAIDEDEFSALLREIGQTHAGGQ
jgi:acyl transferase domain-containing protein/NAD(P)-dependent dehydrogenase (short-subunit alcohol dehydrogenase family)/acyl carrier protein/SAM-dependent methyltransferase